MTISADPLIGTEFLGYSPLVRSTVNRSMVHALMGRLDEARADAESGLVAARGVAELENVVIGLYAMNLWAFHAGQPDGAGQKPEPVAPSRSLAGVGHGECSVFGCRNRLLTRAAPASQRPATESARPSSVAGLCEAGAAHLPQPSSF